MAPSLCLLDVNATPAGTGAWRVFVPALGRFPPDLRALLAPLPVADVNGAAFAALAGRADIARDIDAVGLFLVDPFLNPREAARRLASAGSRRIANYPSVQAFGGETGRALGSVGYGFGEECAMLARFVEKGFRATGFAASADAARALVVAGADRLVALPDPGATAARAAALADDITAAVPDVPVATFVAG